MVRPFFFILLVHRAKKIKVITSVDSEVEELVTVNKKETISDMQVSHVLLKGGSKMSTNG